MSSAPDLSDVIGWMLVAAASVVGIVALAAGRRVVSPVPSRRSVQRSSAQSWSVVLVVDACLIAVTGLAFVVL